MMRCSQCNLLIGRTEKNCPRCGTPTLSGLRLSTRWIAAVGVVMLVVLFAGLWTGARSKFNALPQQVVAPKALPQQVVAPKIRQGMPYKAARAIILSTGWQGSAFKKTILNEIHRDLQQWFVDAGFMEIEDCSPTGDGFCVAEFHDAEGKRKLYVFTTSGSPDEIKYEGHDPQIVSFCIDKKTVNCEQPMNANQIAALFDKRDSVQPAQAQENPWSNENVARVISGLILYDQQCGGLPPDANRALNAMSGGWLDPSFYRGGQHQPGMIGEKEMKAAAVWLIEPFNGLGRERWCRLQEAAVREIDKNMRGH
jgi:hypothetical protein